MSQLSALEQEVNNLRACLEFYADPYTYLAIGFLADHPCGEFAEDFSKTDQGVKPGKRARKVLSLLRKTNNKQSKKK